MAPTTCAGSRLRSKSTCADTTLASGHVVLNKLATELNEVTFNTRSGPLKVA